MAVVVLPSLLATEAGGKSRFESRGPTLREALRELPVADLVLDAKGELRPLVNVYVDGVDARERGGLDLPLEGADTVRLVAAVAGG